MFRINTKDTRRLPAFGPSHSYAVDLPPDVADRFQTSVTPEDVDRHRRLGNDLLTHKPGQLRALAAIQQIAEEYVRVPFPASARAVAERMEPPVGYEQGATHVRNLTKGGFLVRVIPTRHDVDRYHGPRNCRWWALSKPGACRLALWGCDDPSVDYGYCDTHWKALEPQVDKHGFWLPGGPSIPSWVGRTAEWADYVLSTNDA